jgi:hypothetical protein
MTSQYPILGPAEFRGRWIWLVLPGCGQFSCQFHFKKSDPSFFSIITGACELEFQGSLVYPRKAPFLMKETRTDES